MTILRCLRTLILNLMLSGAVIAAEPINPISNLTVEWNKQFLLAIKDAKPSPPVVSRLLALAHTCMYDAWSAYDDKAVGVYFNVKGEHRRPPTERILPFKAIAISYAAHACAVRLMPNGLTGFDALLQEIRTQIAGSHLESSPLAEATRLGLASAAHVLENRSHDGSNQEASEPCIPPAAAKPYCDTSGYQPVNAGNLPIGDISPNHWQPLPNGLSYQEALAPHWGQVTPFSFDSAADYLRAHPIVTEKLPKHFGSPAYLEQVEQAIRDSQTLAGERSGEQKAIVEYWADGPFSYLPPGHFGELAHFVVARDQLSTDDSIKLFFVLHNASFDAGIVIWHLKYIYDYVRPITAVRFIKRGQSIFSWGGPGTPWDTEIEQSTGKPRGYNRWMQGEDWLPYNPTNNPHHPLTPAFPEYVSGHSGFSAASAQALKMFTGSPDFGYVATYDPYGAAWQPTLVESPELIGIHRWLYPSFVSAANQAGWSRRYGGIHFEDGDLVARQIGKHIGHLSWERALYYFNGGDNNEACRTHRRCHVKDNIPDGEPRWISVGKHAPAHEAQ